MTQFAIFDSPIELAFNFFEKLLSKNDKVIDATLGRGFDAQKALSLIPQGFLYGMDVQQEAIDSSFQLLSASFLNFQLYHMSHHNFPDEIEAGSIKLIIYNLGYLPKGNKSLTTLKESTLESLHKAILLLSEGGALSIMCYSGHAEGEIEQENVLKWAQTLDKSRFLVSVHSLLNRSKAPTLCLIQKKVTDESHRTF